MLIEVLRIVVDLFARNAKQWLALGAAEGEMISCGRVEPKGLRAILT